MKKSVLVIMACLCVASVVAMIAALQYSADRESFSPPPFEQAAQKGVPEVSENIGYSELDANLFKFSVAGSITSDDGKCDVWLTNPQSNHVWIKVRIADKDGNILGESGLIKPGEYVKTVNLDEVPDKTTNVTLKIMAYEPDTYYSAGSATLNTVLTVI